MMAANLGLCCGTPINNVGSTLHTMKLCTVSGQSDCTLGVCMGPLMCTGDCRALGAQNEIF